MMPQIDVLRVIPVLEADVVDRVALVVGGVIDEHADRAEAFARLRIAARSA